MAEESTFTSVRLSKSDLDNYIERCKECDIKNHTSFIREMIIAFNEDRLRIRRADIPDNMKKVYHDDN